MKRRRSGVLLAMGLVGLAIPASAGAATTIGQTFTPNLPAIVASTALQSTSPDGQYTVPSGGVITSWSFEAASSPPPQLRFKVARPAGGDNFTIIGQSPVKSPAASTLNTYTDISILVQPGDVLGFFVSATGPAARNASGYGIHTASMLDVQPGIATEFGTVSNIQLDLSATLEPDCDSDGAGDETQDPQVPPGGPCPGGRTLTLDANKNKVKKGKKVRLTGRLTELARQGECQSAQTVDLQRKRPSRTTFTTVEQLQTDAAGNFSAKEKVKKTFQYRAQVPETATCAAGLSNTEKVKVKKPK